MQPVIDCVYIATLFPCVLKAGSIWLMVTLLSNLIHFVLILWGPYRCLASTMVDYAHIIMVLWWGRLELWTILHGMPMVNGWVYVDLFGTYNFILDRPQTILHACQWLRFCWPFLSSPMATCQWEENPLISLLCTIFATLTSFNYPLWCNPKITIVAVARLDLECDSWH